MQKILKEYYEEGRCVGGMVYYAIIEDVFVIGKVTKNPDMQFVAARITEVGFIINGEKYINRRLEENDFTDHKPSKDDDRILETIAESLFVAPYWTLMGDIGKRLNEKWKRGETPPDFHSGMKYIEILQKETEEQLETLKEKWREGAK